MRLSAIALVALLLAGCRTTGKDYSANSGVRQTGVCDDMPITSTAEVMPLRDENCIVTTPTGSLSGERFAAVFLGRDLSWRVFASYTESGHDTYMEPLPLWEALNAMWNPVRTDARNKTGTKEAVIGGRNIKTARFDIAGGGRARRCMGFLLYGDYKGAGYDRRIDGFVCTEGRDDDKWFHEIISSLNLDELLT